MKSFIRWLERIPGVTYKVIRIVKTILNLAPVVAVSCLIIWSYYIFVYQITYKRILQNGELLKGLFYCFIYHILVILTTWSYFVTAFKRPPSKIHISEEEKALLLANPIVDEDGENERYCRRCDNFKPERAHHCMWCEKCVSKMDHHCPWVGNCIGEQNYKAFVLMLFYTVTLATFAGTVAYSLTDEKDPSLYTAMALAFALDVGVGILLGFHLYLVATNQTTLECGINVAESLCDQGKNRYPYSGGLLKNIESVFGENKLMWFFPISSPLRIIYLTPNQN